jgi:hypothetical protein
LKEGAEGAGADAEEALTLTEVERELFAPTDGAAMRGRDDLIIEVGALMETREEERRGSAPTGALRDIALPVAVRCIIIILT